MAMSVGGGEGQSYSDINMTPLIDVMLVLLIIFIITIPSMTHAVKIDNPPPNPTPPIEQPEVIDLTIDFDGTLLWNKSPWIARPCRATSARKHRNRPSPKYTSRSTSLPSTKSWRRPWQTCSTAA